MVHFPVASHPLPPPSLLPTPQSTCWSTQCGDLDDHPDSVFSFTLLPPNMLGVFVSLPKDEWTRRWSHYESTATHLQGREIKTLNFKSIAEGTVREPSNRSRAQTGQFYSGKTSCCPTMTYEESKPLSRALEAPRDLATTDLSSSILRRRRAQVSAAKQKPWNELCPWGPCDALKVED